MQFHLNGFKPGDPQVHSSGQSTSSLQSATPLPETVDVLIVGSGPAGVTLAAQLAAFGQISTRIVETRPGRLILGQADGIACRSMEMFEAFGFSQRVLNEGYWVNEMSFWKPDDASPGDIRRSGKVQDTEDGLSEFPHVILNQARVQDFFLDVMQNSPNHLIPDYSRRLLDLTIHQGSGDNTATRSTSGTNSDYPVTATIERVDPEHEGQIETINARYVVGCDGARSAVRKSIGRALQGDSANQAWGVMDVLAVTDFPDVRLKCLIQSSNDGSIVIIPREGGYLVRYYVELDALGENERVLNKNIVVDDVIAAAQRILHPYKLDVKEVAWWSVYEIGQRLCDKFDDVPDDEVDVRFPRVFIAGDACHTHSPKAGQGMNVSMRDSFNLGWKLASVLLGRCSARLLHTYSQERRAVAKELIDFDREWAQILSARPGNADSNELDESHSNEFQSYFVRHGRYTAGTAIQYQPSMISAGATHQKLARGLVIGQRFHSAPVIRLADARPMQLGHTVKADGRWRLFAFAGIDDKGCVTSGLGRLCEYLVDDPASPVRQFTPALSDVDSVIDVRAVFQQRSDLDVELMPSLLLPCKGRYQLRDYEKAFYADQKPDSDVFELRDIDREKGCMVVVRPDQHIAHILPLDAYDELATFFCGFMLPANT